MCSVEIAYGASWTLSRSVHLGVSAPGATKVQVKNSLGESWSVLSSANWNLAAGADGPRCVYVYCLTGEGQQSNVFVDRICLDTLTPPTVKSLTINRGAQTAASRAVELRIYPDCAAAVRFRNHPLDAWGAWQPLERCEFGESTWSLAQGPDGSRTVYAQARDHNGNLSPVISDTIMLQRPVPLIGQVRDRALGSALVGATVVLYQNSVAVASATAAAPYGVYAFDEGLASGVYVLVASAGRYVRQIKKDIAVTEDSTTYVNFNLQMSGKLMGQVRDRPSGADLVGATVFARSGGIIWATTTTTAPWGVYEINADLPPGTYVVQASQTGYLAQAKKSIIVTAGVTTYVNFNLYYAAK